MMDLKDSLLDLTETRCDDCKYHSTCGGTADYKVLCPCEADQIIDVLSEQGVGVLEHDGKRILIKEKSYTGTTLRTTFIPLQEVQGGCNT